MCGVNNQQVKVVHQMQTYFIVQSAKGILYLHKLGSVHNYIPNKQSMSNKYFLRHLFLQ